MNDLNNLFPVLIGLALGGAIMWAFLKYRPDEKVSATRDADAAVKRLVTVLGVDDSEDAKRRAHELKLALESLAKSVDKIPTVK